MVSVRKERIPAPGTFVVLRPKNRFRLRAKVRLSREEDKKHLWYKNCLIGKWFTLDGDDIIGNLDKECYVDAKLLGADPLLVVDVACSERRGVELIVLHPAHGTLVLNLSEVTRCRATASRQKKMPENRAL